MNDIQKHLIAKLRAATDELQQAEIQLREARRHALDVGLSDAEIRDAIDGPGQPSTSSDWARRQAIEAAEAAVRSAKDRRNAGYGGQR